jgi:hypothetical protein
LPVNAGEREIRFVEINRLLGDRNDDSLEPIDFGVDPGRVTAHKLVVLDVTPDQWRRIEDRKLSLPENWSLERKIFYRKQSGDSSTKE